jgi:hypothetical protein
LPDKVTICRSFVARHVKSAQIFCFVLESGPKEVSATKAKTDERHIRSSRLSAFSVFVGGRFTCSAIQSKLNVALAHLEPGIDSLEMARNNRDGCAIFQFHSLGEVESKEKRREGVY